MFVGMALALLVWAFSTDFWPLAAFALAYGVFYGGRRIATRYDRLAVIT
jgi:OFA family oxalate/formate antiporter-like MFS transporter